MRKRIVNARTVQSSIETENVIELLLRAWTAHCMATYNFATIPTGSTLEDEPIVQFIFRNLAAMGPCPDLP